MAIKINLVGREEINLELAIGKQKSLKLKELDKEVQKFQKSGEEDKMLDAVCEIIAEFSNLESGEKARDCLTDVEIMDLYFAIRGDIESVNRVFTLTSKTK